MYMKGGMGEEARLYRERKKWKIVLKGIEEKIAPREECITMDGKNVFLCTKMKEMGLKIVRRKGEMPLSWRLREGIS